MTQKNNLFQTLFYTVLQILLLPFAIIGVVLMMWKEMRGSRKHGVSYTAGQAIQGRWLMHYFGTREEETMARFMKALPVESHFGYMSVMSAALLAHRICGYTPALARIGEPSKVGVTGFLNVRTTEIDRLMRESIGQVEQVVVMGGGFDVRVLDQTRGEDDLAVFELDMEATQRMKLATLKKAGIEHDWVQYLSIDFRNESWADRLRAAGFDLTKKTFWLWESVNLYLEEEVVKETLNKMSELSAAGSVVALDLYERAFIMGETSKTVRRSLAFLEKIQEPWLYGIDTSGGARAAAEALLNECGLVLNGVLACGEASKVSGGRPFYFVVEAGKRA